MKRLQAHAVGFHIYFTDTIELYVRAAIAVSGPGEKFFFGPTGKGGPVREKSREPNHPYARWAMAASATQEKKTQPNYI
jgi:hypothetical protein